MTQMNFYEQTGPMALVSRMRQLTDRLTEQAQRMYECYAIDLKPKWFPVFFVLSSQDDMTVTSIAQQIGHSHPSVSKIVREMSAGGIIAERKDDADARKTLISLSRKGRQIALKIRDQYADVTAAVNAVTQHTTHNLWQALGEWEELLDDQSMVERILEQRRLRERAHIRIVNYDPVYLHTFQALNEAWIRRYFEMEDADYKVLGNPESCILDQGGHILVALYKNEPVGVCALLKATDPKYDFEMAKMAVSPSVQGLHIGYLLGLAIIQRAKKQGARSIYLESSTNLIAAIRLYRKLGFKRIEDIPSPYRRCNIRMGLML